MDVSKIPGAQPTPRPGGPVSGKNADRARSGDASLASRPQSADGDVADLSTSAADFRASIEALADRAKNGGDRSDVVEAARARLASGQLDAPSVYEAVARRLTAEG